MAGGEVRGVVEVSDPRPVVESCVVLGARCATCSRPSAWRHDHCPECRGRCEPAAFGPGGTVWSSATVHLPVGDRVPPFTLVYVDLDSTDDGRPAGRADPAGPTGPRVLARSVTVGELEPGSMVSITGTDAGDIVVASRVASPGGDDGAS